jgi:hypothetical protein
MNQIGHIVHLCLVVVGSCLLAGRACQLRFLTGIVLICELLNAFLKSALALTSLQDDALDVRFQLFLMRLRFTVTHQNGFLVL